MASEFCLNEVSGFFDQTYGKPIDPGSYDVWRRIFKDVPDGTMTKAAHWLIEHRDISRAVVPGEMSKAVEAVGGTVRRYKAEKTFEDDPIVRALDSRSMADEGGISLHDWLKQEGFGSFSEAMVKYADYNDGRVQVLEMAGGIATKVTLPTKEKTWEEIVKEADGDH